MKQFLFLIMFLIYQMAISQESHGGIPYTFKVNINDSLAPNYRQVSHDIPITNLPFFDNDNLRTIADTVKGNCVECKNKFYGKVLTYNLDIIANATYQIIDSMKIWRYAISSSSAEGLQFYFSRFKIPEGGELYFYDTKKSFLSGNFNAENNPIDSLASIQFGTIPFIGDTIIIEYNQLMTISELPVLEIINVVHVFNNKFSTQNTAQRSQSESCQVDINCIDGYGWESERNSTVLIMYNTGTWTGLCTGNMINTSLQNESRYLLTAGHCLKDLDAGYTASASSLMFLFNYQTSCNFGTIPYNTLYSVFGAIDLSTANLSNGGNYVDYSLLQINASKETLRDWNVCYAGWKRTTSLNSFDMPLTMIHHPSGDTKKISFTQSNLPLNSAIYPNDPSPNTSKPFYLVYWENGGMKGMSEGGSSGAGIFDYSHHLIGNLIGGNPDNCQTLDRKSTINKFYSSWTHGNLGFWLDPNNSNVQVVNTYCPSSNIDPTGTGGGGSSSYCDPKTIIFKVNGHATFNTPNTVITNVCKENVTLSPVSGCPPNYSPNTIWDYKTKTVQTWCSSVPDRWAAASESKYFLGLKCTCKFFQLFISAQECDANLNLIGPEFSGWMYIYDGDKSGTAEYLGFQSFNISDYLHMPPFLGGGSFFKEGKYYKVKVATFDHFWWEHSAYIKTFDPVNANVIQNKTLTLNEVGTDITIINSNVPFSSGSIKVAAENKISIQSNSQLQTGRYFIQDIDCNNINQFRTHNPDSIPHQPNIQQAAPSTDNNYSNITELKTHYSNEANLLELSPNPCNFSARLKFNLSKSSEVSSLLYDINGKIISEIISPLNLNEGTYDIKINTEDIFNGVYIVKTVIDSKSYINKLIVNHD